VKPLKVNTGGCCPYGESYHRRMLLLLRTRRSATEGCYHGRMLPRTSAPDGSVRSCGKTAHALVFVAAAHVRPWSVEVVCHRLAAALSRNTESRVLPSGLQACSANFVVATRHRSIRWCRRARASQGQGQIRQGLHACMPILRNQRLTSLKFGIL
jgi:hypothetical protein